VLIDYLVTFELQIGVNDVLYESPQILSATLQLGEVINQGAQKMQHQLQSGK